MNAATFMIDMNLVSHSYRVRKNHKCVYVVSIMKEKLMTVDSIALCLLLFLVFFYSDLVSYRSGFTF